MLAQMMLPRMLQQCVKRSPSSVTRLQDNHYRPEGSESCLLCDCYPIGSFSRACDRESGQCQCKPGVIGRQCDRCDNPFAEVSPNGCEGKQTHTQRVRQSLLLENPSFHT